MKKLVGIIGSAMLGTDPFHERAWSGSSRNFFLECRRRKILHRAFGVEAPLPARTWSIARNFSTDGDLWRLKHHLDTGYYRALTNQIARTLQPDDMDCDLLQIGGIYDVPSIVKGRTRCFSYHDGNLAQFSRSPHFRRDAPRSVLGRALEYERKVYAGMDRIFTMSDYLRKSFLEDFGLAETKVMTIGGGVNLDRIPDLRRDKYCDTGEILFVGVDFERKGGPQVLEAFRHVRGARPEATLHIVGPRQLDIPPGLREGVTYHGFLDRRNALHREKFERILSSAALFVMPSRYEPFGIAPLEAMANEVPCILSRRWAFPEMVEPGENGELVEPDDVDGLTDRILFLLARPDLLRKYGKAGRERVLRRYTWESVVTNLERGIAECSI